MVGTAITPLNTEYRAVYNARDGTLEIDATDQAEQIMVNAAVTSATARRSTSPNRRNSPAPRCSTP